MNLFFLYINFVIFLWFLALGITTNSVPFCAIPNGLLSMVYAFIALKGGKMQAILKFNLPEEKDEFTLATKGSDYWACLWDLNQWLRNELKHHSDFWSKSNGCIQLEATRDKLFEILEDRNCSLDDVN